MATLLLNAVQLRALADYAAGLRGPGGDDVYITAQIQPDGYMVLGNGPVALGPPPDTVLQCDTSDVTARQAVTLVQITTNEGVLDLQDKYDAVFWSESAVEKFVIPYYASKSLWLAGHVLNVLCEKWYGTMPGGPPGLDPMPVIPFAVAHLPSSDYVTLSGPDQPLTGGAVGADLVLLAFDPGSGKITETPLSDYL